MVLYRAGLVFLSLDEAAPDMVFGKRHVDALDILAVPAAVDDVEARIVALPVAQAEEPVGAAARERSGIELVREGAALLGVVDRGVARARVVDILVERRLKLVVEPVFYVANASRKGEGRKRLEAIARVEDDCPPVGSLLV